VLKSDPADGISLSQLQQILAESYTLRTPIQTLQAKLQVLETSGLVEAEIEYDDDDATGTGETAYYYPTQTGVVVETTPPHSNQNGNQLRHHSAA